MTDKSPESWPASSMHYIRYAWSTIRQEGVGYFLKRTSELLSLQANRLFESIHLTRSYRFEDRLVKIDDINYDDASQINQRLDNPPSLIDSADQISYPGSSINAQHERLVALGNTVHEQLSQDRQALVEQAIQLFSKRRVLFVSPIRVLGGGANLIFLAVRAMRQMGVDAQLLNLKVHRRWFEEHFPDLSVPVSYAEVEQIPQVATGFEAVIATSNPSVAWIAPVIQVNPGLKCGYYIQDFEPYFYPPGSHEYRRAAASYTLIPGLVRMVTTPWIAEQIRQAYGVESTLVGAHLDTGLFRPRRRSEHSWPDRPLRITAMIRPSTPRRNPNITMSVLEQICQKYPSKVEIRLFGCDLSEPGFSLLPTDFPWQLAGQLRSTQVANLFNEADIFIDLSKFQALGLTALEAMASGLAVIVPKEGGTSVYAKNGENCLVVDTHDQQACLSVLQRLVENDALRYKLQENAVSMAAGFFAELPALNMLRALFQGEG